MLFKHKLPIFSQNDIQRVKKLNKYFTKFQPDFLLYSSNRFCALCTKSAFGLQVKCFHGHWLSSKQTNKYWILTWHVPWSRCRQLLRSFPVEIFRYRTGPAKMSYQHRYRPGGLSAIKKRKRSHKSSITIAFLSSARQSSQSISLLNTVYVNFTISFFEWISRAEPWQLPGSILKWPLLSWSKIYLQQSRI